MVEIVSNKSINLDEMRKFSSYIGKKVFSKTGEFMGEVYDIAIKKDTIVGVFYKGNLNVFIDKEFFESDTKEAIMLKIEPVTRLIGKEVYDSTGELIGEVVELKRKGNSNSYDELRVKKGFFYKSVYIPKEKIAVAKKNIILKGPWEQK